MDAGASAQDNPLGPYLALAQSARGFAAVDVLKKVFEAPGIYLFGDLFEIRGIRELEFGAHDSYFKLLQLFAYGNYRQYLCHRTLLPNMSPAQTRKLQLLSLVKLAAKSKHISYERMLWELAICSDEELEDIIKDAIHCGIIQARLNRESKHLEVQSALVRDVRQDDMDPVIMSLKDISDEEDQLYKKQAIKEKTHRARHRAAVAKQAQKMKSRTDSTSFAGNC